MERKDLEAKGFTAEQIDDIMAMHGKTAQGLKSQVDALTAERDGLQSQLSEVTTKLDTFKDFKPEEMTAELEKLKGEIVTMEQSHKDALSTRDLTDLLTNKITGAGGMNSKAIMSLLDLDKIKESKERSSEVETQLAALKESDAYLFKVEQGAPPPAAGTGTGTLPASGEKSLFQKLNDHRIVGK